MKRVVLLALILCTCYVSAQANNVSRQQFASLKADQDALAEEQKLQIARIMGLEQEIAKRDAIIREMQTIINAMDKKIADLDAKLNDTRASVGRDLEGIRKGQQEFAKNVSKEIARSSTPQQPATPQYSSYLELEVMKGDTLSTIASAAKISVAELKRINNLKSDVIRQGQILKVPKK